MVVAETNSKDYGEGGWPGQIQTAVVGNPATIPPYSVVCLEWTVAKLPPPALALVVTNGAQYLVWTGLTNVIYNVEAASNLPGAWTIVGRVANTAPNFAFTNWGAALRHFYRLAVP